MERYIAELNRLKTSSWSIITSDIGLADREYDKSIVLIPEIYDSCPALSELTNALTKRLANNQLCSVAMCCICSYNYTVSHMSLSSISIKTFLSIWGHLETLQKSSSSKLSEWLIKAMNGRSQDGYNFKFGDILHNTDNDSRIKAPISRKHFGTKVRPMGILFSEKYFGEASTIRDAMIADWCMLSAAKVVYDESIPDVNVIRSDQQQ